MMPHPQTFNAFVFHTLCDHLADGDADLRQVLKTYGYPPFWDRPSSYETLVHIILEQQVSLASAKAALEKLRLRIGIITPAQVMLLTDEELKACYFSRQKISYVRGLSEAVMAGQIVIEELDHMPDELIRERLTALKGIGNWTVDVYLILVLHRLDHFPFGDIAAVNGLKELKRLPKSTPAATLVAIVDNWKPYRSVGAMLTWHYYLSVRGRH